MSHERYGFYFTIENRIEPILYSFHSNITIKQFIEFMKDEMKHLSSKNIEIFETVNDDIKRKKIDYNEKYTLQQIFDSRIKETSSNLKFTDTSFYVKFIDDC